MCTIFTSAIKSSNECVNGIIFPGSTLPSNYWPNTFAADKDKNHVQLLYLPTSEQARLQFWKGDLCIHNDLPQYIPALFVWKLPSATSCILYFHGNAADISHVYRMAIRQSVIYNAHFIAVEYPRYGFSDGNPSQESINAVALIAYNFIVDRLAIPSSRVVLMGNSIGTGPACYLAAYLESISRPPAALILHAPYTTITNVAKDVLECLPSCFLNRWTNYKYLIGEDPKTIRCPVLFLHADNDKIIDYEHSLSMHRMRIAKKLPSFLFTQKSTDDFIKGHNHFNYIYDLETPIASFLKNVFNSLEPRSFAVDLSVLEAYSRVPEVYQYRTRETHSKRSRGVILRWMCCPCVFSIEACLACSLESLRQLEAFFDPPPPPVTTPVSTPRSNSALMEQQHILPAERAYVYQTKAMRGLDHLTLTTVLRKLITTGSTANVIEESTQAKAKTGEDKPVVNPLQSSSSVSSTVSSSSAAIEKEDTLREALVSSASPSSPSDDSGTAILRRTSAGRRSNRGSYRGDDVAVVATGTRPAAFTMQRQSSTTITYESSTATTSTSLEEADDENSGSNTDTVAIIVDAEPDPGTAMGSSINK
jgi:abhydrolase domain-containing protein 17